MVLRNRAVVTTEHGHNAIGIKKKIFSEMNQVHGMDIDKKIIQALSEVERRGRGLETTAVILLLPNLFNENLSGLYVRDKISPLFTPLLHIGGNPFHHESENPAGL
ncbi:uncharacterized protein ACWYII_003342 isoform 1-T1 [Salvelinus alpinus]